MENYVTDKRTRTGASNGEEKMRRGERGGREFRKQPKLQEKFKGTKPNKLIEKLYKADSLFFLFVLLKSSRQKNRGVLFIHLCTQKKTLGVEAVEDID